MCYFFSGGLANRGDSKCVENVKSDWKFADGTGWTKDPLLEATCEKDQSGKIFFSKIIIFVDWIKVQIQVMKNMYSTGLRKAHKSNWLNKIDTGMILKIIFN